MLQGGYMKISALPLFVFLLATCSQHLTPPIFDFETTKSWQVGYGMHSDSREEVHAHTGGTVVFVSEDQDNPTNLGKYVIVEHTKMLTGSGLNVSIKYYSLYALLGDTSVKVGQMVNSNALVGMTGPTGRIAALENGATLLFGIYAETDNKEIDQLWGCPTKAYGKFWYDLERVLGGNSPTRLTNGIDPGSYSRSSLGYLLSAVHPDGGDQNFGFNKYVVSAEIAEYPSPLTSAYKSILADYVRANNLPVLMNQVYGARFVEQQKDFKVVFYLQSVQLDSFRREVTLGKTIDLYLISGFYSRQQRALCLFVNDFNARN
jgi:murein DD-endopeptidase MepM/ murein hydrolase activator NlpD